ncbi:hypothetical protein LCGC14_0193080 [marine sediment metagenome]
MKQGAILIDGAGLDNAFGWLYKNYPSHQPRPLLFDIPYVSLMHLGPILIDASEGSALYLAWTQGAEGLRNSVWLETIQPIDQIFSSLQQRLQVRSPDGRTLWLRMADARPLRKAWEVGAEWPAGFWYGISSVWLLSDGEPRLAWINEEPGLDCAPRADSANKQIMLDWPLLEALAQGTDNLEEVPT